MKYLTPGLVDQPYLDLLLELSSVRSEAAIEGLSWHLVKGHPLDTAAALAQYTTGNLHRAVASVERIAGIVEAIKEHQRFKR